MVATLRIADHIAAGTTDIKTLAEEAGCDPDSLLRVLRYLVDKGVFQEPAPGRFALNEAALELLDPSMQLGLDLGGIGGRMAYAWGSLLSAVRTGTSAYHELFGLPFWEDLEAHPDIAASFDALMGPPGHGTPDPEVLLTGGWEEVKTVAAGRERCSQRSCVPDPRPMARWSIFPGRWLAQARSCRRPAWVNGSGWSGRVSSTRYQLVRISISSSLFSTTGPTGKPG